MENLGKCSERVYSGYRWDFSGHHCQNKAVIIEDGKPFCKRHSKAGKEAHLNKRQERINTELAKSKKKYERMDAISQIVDGFATDKLIQYEDTIREFIGRL